MSATCFNLDKSKILSSGNVLKKKKQSQAERKTLNKKGEMFKTGHIHIYSKFAQDHFFLVKYFCILWKLHKYFCVS